MTQQEFLDAIRALLKEYGGYTLEGPDWAGDVILRREMTGGHDRLIRLALASVGQLP